MTFKKTGLIMIFGAVFTLVGIFPQEMVYCPADTVRPFGKQSTGKTDLSQPPNGAFRTITDMAGRRVSLATTVTKVLSTSPPPATFVYMLAPDKLGGWVGRSFDDTRKFIPPAYHDIPVFGWGRNSTNYEAFIAARPDLVFIGCEKGFDLSRVDLIQEKFGDIPVLCVDDTRNATGYGATLNFVGEVLGVADRAAALVAYYQHVLKEVQENVDAIPAGRRVHVYYAEGNSGLSTDPSGSPHSQLIDVCGGINVADCMLSSGSGMTPVTMEAVLMWKPEVIITTNLEFAALAGNHPTWKMIPAVRNHRVYLTPSHPFNWFDRPPGVNRIIGIPWTAHILYPAIFSEAWFRKKVKDFYSLYYHYSLSDEELNSLL